ncbi:MAG: response regulator transcription factor [Firmicutes bacterium]|nr:response regulator transcription factor [Bacillota bacterium]
MLNILVAEDNDRLRQLMKIHLRRAGYQVTEAADGEEALAALEAGPVHLMIVDVMMPKLDGLELTRSLREARIQVPVLMVTARETLDDKRAGFKAGADDYLVKPVDMEEMLLHVAALLRRAALTSQPVITVGGTTLNERSLTVTREGEELTLRQKEFQLLHLLLSYRNRIFTRQMLMDEIWGYDSETDPRTVDVHIKRLREKLAGNPDFTIETVRGLGYKAVVK